MPHVPGDIIGPNNEYTILSGGGGVVEESARRAHLNTPLGANRTAAIYQNVQIPAEQEFIAFTQTYVYDYNPVANYDRVLCLYTPGWPQALVGLDNAFRKLFIGLVNVAGAPNTMGYEIRYVTPAAGSMFWDFDNQIWAPARIVPNMLTFATDGAGNNALYNFYIECRHGDFTVWGECLSHANGTAVGGLTVRTPFRTAPVACVLTQEGLNASWLSCGNTSTTRQAARRLIFHLSLDYYKWRNR